MSQLLNKDRQNRTSLVSFLIVLTLILSISFMMLRPYLLSIFMGGMLAILARPLYLKLIRRGWKHSLAGITLTLGILFLIVGPLSTFLYLAVKQAVSFGQHLVSGQNLSFDRVLDRAWSLSPAPLRDVMGSQENLSTQVQNALKRTGSLLSSGVLAMLSSLPDLGLQIVLSLLSCFYFLVDGERFVNWSVGRLPLDSDIRDHLINSFKDMTISTIWATLAAASTQASVMLIAYLVLGVPGAFLAAGATFVLAWIPFIGSTPVWLIGTAYLANQHSMGKAAGMLAFGIFTTLIDNLVRPWVLKGRGDLHPLVSLVSIFGALALFGPFGVFYGPILISVLLSLLQTWPVVARRFGIIVAPPDSSSAIPSPDLESSEKQAS